MARVLRLPAAVVTERWSSREAIALSEPPGPEVLEPGPTRIDRGERLLRVRAGNSNTLMRDSIATREVIAVVLPPRLLRRDHVPCAVELRGDDPLLMVRR